MDADAIFVVSEPALDASCQTAPPSSLSPNSMGPPPLVGSGSALLRQYRENLSYFLDMADQTAVSDFRSEVLNCVREHKIFQERLFGRSSPPLGQLPPNAFHEFTVSLHLSLFHDRFVMSSTIPGFEISGGAHEIEPLLAALSTGFLPAHTLDALRKVNLVWYDGGLICEVNDNRVSPPAFIRVHLLANQEYADIDAALAQSNTIENENIERNDEGGGSSLREGSDEVLPETQPRETGRTGETQGEAREAIRRVRENLMFVLLCEKSL